MKRHYKYNPLHVYAKPVEQTTLEEAIAKNQSLLELFELQNRLGSWYKTKVTLAGNMLESETFLSFNRKDYSRAKKEERTGKAQRTQNAKNSQRTFVRHTRANFGEGDFFSTFGFPDNFPPLNLQECHKRVKAYLDRIRGYMKRAGEKAPLKYIYVIEETIKATTGKPRYHVHLLISKSAGSNKDGVPARDHLEDLWKNKRGKHQGAPFPNVQRIQETETGFTGLSTYFTKHFESEKFDEFKEIADSTQKHKRKWRSSNNLVPYNEPPKINTRFGKKKVKKLLKTPAAMKEIFESEYPGYSYIEDWPCEVSYSEVIDGVYLYCRMYKRE